MSRIPGDFCDRHHNEARANGGTRTRENLVFLWRKLHHEPYTLYFELRTFYQAFGALAHGAKYRSWLGSPETLSAERLGTVIGRMRVSPLTRRIIEYELDAEGRALLCRLFSRRNFHADGSPDLVRMARVMCRMHRKHEAWARMEEARIIREIAEAQRIARAGVSVPQLVPAFA